MSARKKLEVLRVVEGSGLPVVESLARLDIPASTDFRWRRRFRRHGLDGLRDRSPYNGRRSRETILQRSLY